VSFLDLAGKKFVVFGVANKRSVAYRIGALLEEEGATVIYSVQSESLRDGLGQLLAGREVQVCDVERQEQIDALARAVRERHTTVHGIVHSIAFANYESFSGVFHEVRREDFLQCVSVSCYSLIAIANAFKEILDRRASIVTISISTTRMAVESYGYMAPAKAALDSAVAFLAKSFSRFSEVRFNAVCAGLLKTSASAGIPGYIDHYMFAEQVSPRKRALSTDEVANVAAFLLSEASSGINAQGVVVDCGMGTNYFDAEVVKNTLAGVWPTRTP
jgi:enoyl-[acyl-carrier protein] reductase I